MCPNGRYFGLEVVPILVLGGQYVYTRWIHGPLGLNSRTSIHKGLLGAFEGLPWEQTLKPQTSNPISTKPSTLPIGSLVVPFWDYLIGF